MEYAKMKKVNIWKRKTYYLIRSKYSQVSNLHEQLSDYRYLGASGTGHKMMSKGIKKKKMKYNEIKEDKQKRPKTICCRMLTISFSEK